jgi:signal transduction histidine kinase
MRSDHFGGKGKLLRHELSVKHKDGHDIPVSFSGGIIYDRDQEIATFGLFTDLRAMQRIEEDLEQTHRMLMQSEKMAGLGRLAAGVAHEINNPLTAINANAEMLKLTIPADDENYESVDLIQQAGERATKVVRGLLDFARQEQYAFTPDNVNKSIGQALALVQYQLQTANTRVIQNMSDELPRVVASWEHLKSVWLNLIVNARDALQDLPVDRQIEIITRPGSDSNHIQVLFRDNGKGMSEAELAHIFEPFYTTKDPGKGTGLGLATSHRIIEQHGGEINVVSVPGEGTTFIIRLPVNDNG